ncbi:MAG: hypothetical protein KAU44_02220, partial [Candidatus Marinimicrobia bacterium]|nr:hypothetical protein [Candidatus Neomarinimicrobiota bacterium]
MKKIILTLLLIVVIVPQLFAETGTVTLSYANGTVSYNDTQTFYEFDVQVYIDGGSGSNIFDDGMVYIEYNTSVFGSSVESSGKIVSITKMGPFAVDGGGLYSIINPTDMTSNIFVFTFEATNAYDDSGYDSDTYISNSSGSLSTLFRIKMEVSVSGSSNVAWPTGIPDLNLIYTEHDASNSTYEALSVANAV